MDLNKYTERAKGFLLNAQTLAQRASHQRVVPEHLLKVLLDDEEGLAAGLIKSAGGDPARAKAAVVGTASLSGKERALLRAAYASCGGL